MTQIRDNCRQNGGWISPRFVYTSARDEESCSEVTPGEVEGPPYDAVEAVGSAMRLSLAKLLPECEGRRWGEGWGGWKGGRGRDGGGVGGWVGGRRTGEVDEGGWVVGGMGGYDVGVGGEVWGRGGLMGGVE